MTCPAVIRITIPSVPKVVRIVAQLAPKIVQIKTPGPPGAVSVRQARHDWSDPYDYLGVARVGTLESASSWRVTRLLINSAGLVTETKIAENIAWADRLTAIYL